MSALSTIRSLVNVCTIYHQIFGQCLHYLSQGLWSMSALFTIRSLINICTIRQRKAGKLKVYGNTWEEAVTDCTSWKLDLHYLPLSLWSMSALFTIRSLINVCTIYHQVFDQYLHYSPEKGGEA